MVRWSRYSCHFTTARGEHLVYNALSNSLLQLDDAHDRAVARLHRLSETPGGADETALGAGLGAGGEAVDPGLLPALRRHLVLVAADEEDEALLAERTARNAAAYRTGMVGLTICPTLACNFRCGYCFEHSQHDGKVMTSETAGHLVAFIRGHEDARRLSLAWYGGEPTLAWDRIRDLTERFLGLGLVFEPAGLVTNGYLLDERRIGQLADLRIETIQVTLDGPPETHDARRVLPGGGPTYARILDNLDVLMASAWGGRLSVRVNVDRTNAECFTEFREELLQRFSTPRVRVYAGHVSPAPGDQATADCALCASEWHELALALYWEHGMLPARGFYPPSTPAGCVATAPSGYVVGPAGELYDCWEDVGDADMVIGDVAADPPVTDPGLHARYLVGTDPFGDPECLACDVLPVCNGGCAAKRLRAQRGEPTGDHCSPYRRHLEAYLEAYLDAFLTRELCAAVLAPGPPGERPGWRLVSPEPATSAGAALTPLDGD